jgi:type II secretion system protein H
MRRLKTCGFTLVELLVVLSIMGLLLCCALPRFRAADASQNLTRVVNDLTHVIQFARYQSLLQGETLVLQPLDAQNNWSHGMRLVVREGSSTPPRVKKVLHEWHWNHRNMQLSWHGFQSRNYLIMDADLNRLAMNGHFLWNDGMGLLKKIEVNRFGRVHVA